MSDKKERTIKSPGQVVRYDGTKVFAELMCNGIAIDRVEINFCQYDKTAEKGSRMGNTVRIFLEMSKAAVLAEEILSGRLAKKAKVSREKAAAKGSNYPDAVYGVMGGSKADKVKREDGKAESRQFKIFPGNKLPWILMAEKGPGHENDKGLIVPDYTTGRGTDAVIRIPMTDESLYGFALHLKSLFELWTLEKFGNVHNFDPSTLKGYDSVTQCKRTSLYAHFKQDEEAVNTEGTMLNKGVRMSMRVSALPIDKLQLEITSSDWTVYPVNDTEMLTVFMDISRAGVMAMDILSGRIAKLAAQLKKSGKNEPAYISLGGSNKDGKITSRQFKILAGNTPDTDGKWIIQVESGPGHLSDTGLFVPDYNENTADKVHKLCLDSDELKRFALCIQQLMSLWTIKKYGPVIQPAIDRRRKATEDEIAKRRPIQ